MESIHALKKCLDYVAGLSKKLLGTNTIYFARTNVEKVPQKSHPNLQELEQTLGKANIVIDKNIQSLQKNKYQTPKIICFESYMRSKADLQKLRSLKPLINQERTHRKLINQTNTNLDWSETVRANECIRKIHLNRKLADYPESQLKINIHKNIQNKLAQNENSQLKINKSRISGKYNLVNIRKQVKKFLQEDEEDQQIIELGKKDKKNLKKIQKNPQTAESVAINPDPIPFTYGDGDDISSIAQISETTDDIQPELLFFIDRRTQMAYEKLEQSKSNLVMKSNMKKKVSHQQGQTIVNNLPIKHQVQEQQQKPCPKKRTFQPYPGETIQQFKKHVLLRYPAFGDSDQFKKNVLVRYLPSGDSQSDQPSLFKPMKKQDYNKILDQINNKGSRIEQQKLKQRPQNKVQKMVDESESQQSQRYKQQIQDDYFQQIENYSSQNKNVQIKNKIHFHEV